MQPNCNELDALEPFLTRPIVMSNLITVILAILIVVVEAHNCRTNNIYSVIVRINIYYYLKPKL